WGCGGGVVGREVKGMVWGRGAERDELSKATGKLFERLVSESCKTETQDAVKYEGPSVFQSAFTVLGQVASIGLFTDPSVSGYMGDFLKYIDKSKVQGAFLSK